MENPTIRSIKNKGQKFSERMKNNGKGNRLKFTLILATIVIVVITTYLVWDNFLNAEAIERRKQQKMYDEFFQALEEGEQKQREDIYGGTTPQETLDMFVSALEKGDLELASKYFSLTVEGKTDPKWLVALEKAKEEGKIEEIILALKAAKEDKEESINPKIHAIFEAKDNQGELLLDISFLLNENSNLWKIERI